MSCWEILEIEANSDVKTIKKAYTKKLKVTKPDENPEGFKELHSAYKLATRIAKSQAASQIDEDQAETLTTDNVTSEAQESQDASEAPSFQEANYHYHNVVITNDSLIEEQQERSQEEEKSETLDTTNEYIDQQQEALLIEEPEEFATEELLADAVKELIQDKSKVNDKMAWEKLLTASILFQIHVKSWFTFFLFNQILIDQKSKTPALNQATLTHLNERILWTHQTERLEHHFSYEDISFFIHQLRTPLERFSHQYVCPKQHTGDLEFANYYRKLGAGAIDLGIFFAGWFGLMSMSLQADIFVWAFIAWFIALFPAMEASPFQATPGKMMLGMKVLSPKGKRLNIIHAILRSTLFALSTIGFKFTVWINLFINDGRMLHDRLSHSWVVKR